MKKFPDKHGHFGDYGGIFAPETLMHPLAELAVLQQSHPVLGALGVDE